MISLKKRIAFFCVCGFIILLSAALDIYEHFVLLPLREKNFLISPWTEIYRLAAKPAFWLCLGTVFALAVFYKARIRSLRKILLWVGVLVIVLYAAIAFFSSVRGSGASRPALSFLVWLTNNATIFLIPGIFVGIGLEKEECDP